MSVPCAECYFPWLMLGIKPTYNGVTRRLVVSGFAVAFLLAAPGGTLGILIGCPNHASHTGSHADDPVSVGEMVADHGDHDDHQRADHDESHECTCQGACQGAGTVSLPADGSVAVADGSAGRSSIAHGLPLARHGQTDYALPFANGPPLS